MRRESRNDALLDADTIRGNEQFIRALLPKKFHHFYDGLVRTALATRSESKPPKELLRWAVEAIEAKYNIFPTSEDGKNLARLRSYANE